MSGRPSIADRVRASYLEWFGALAKLAGRPLNEDDWTGRWYDGFTPEAALAAGPDPDREIAPPSPFKTGGGR